MLLQLPVWFQAVKNVSATQSGVQNLPLIMAHVISALLAGGLVTYTGYYTPFMIISSVLISLGAGFLTTFNPTTAVSYLDPPSSITDVNAYQRQNPTSPPAGSVTKLFSASAPAWA